MDQYRYREDSTSDRKSSSSRKTCPARSGTDHSKKMRMAHSTGDLNTDTYYTRNIGRNHGHVAHFKEKVSLLYPDRYVNADGKPNPSRTGGFAQRDNEGRETMKVEGTPPDEGTSEQMDAEDVNNVQTHSSTPRKVFPGHSRSTIPIAERMENESVSSGDYGDYTRLSPAFGVEDLHIRDSQYHTQRLPEFTNRTAAAAQSFQPIHQNLDNVTQPRISESTSGLPQADMRDARNRLKTFKTYWPTDSEFFNMEVLASAGFYATGAGDAVRCFECHATIANWEKDDDPKRRHLEISRQCRFANGSICGDRPLSPVRNSKRYPGGSSPGRSLGRNRHHRNSQDKSKRFHIRPHRTTNQASLRPQVMRHRSVSPRQDQSGQGPPGRFSRSNSPPPYPRINPRSASTPPPSPMALAPPAVHEYMNPTPSLIERNNWMDVFPCNAPANPNMREVSARRRTFDNSLFRANTRLTASNSTLAEAGMYYTGQSDDTKCWYCGGGLRRYQPNDDPWVEHAKYFPDCEYLLQQRGPGWIHSISVQFPNVVRPASPRMHNLGVPSLRQPSPAPANPTPMAPQQLQNTPAVPPVIGGQFQHTPLVIPNRPQQIRNQGPTTPTSPHILDRQLPQQPHPMSPPPPPQNPPRNLIQQPVPNVPQQPPPLPPPALSGPRNIRTAGGSGIEDPQAMIREREQMVEASMHTEAVQGVRNMGFTEDQIRTAQMRRIIGLGAPYQTAEVLLESLLNPNTDPTVLEPPQQPPPPPAPRVIRGRHVNIRNGRIEITGGNFNRAVFGATRGRSNIIIDGVPLHEYVAQRQAEANIVGPAPPVVFNNVGTAVATRPYHTAPNPSTAPMNAGTSTTNSNDVPSTSSTNPPEPTGTAEERLEALQKEYQCKICYSARVEVLFEPCGHICACLSCGSRVTHCPMCRKRITRYIKTYHC